VPWPAQDDYRVRSREFVTRVLERQPPKTIGSSGILPTALRDDNAVRFTQLDGHSGDARLGPADAVPADVERRIRVRSERRIIVKHYSLHHATPGSTSGRWDVRS
jgi:hypothetical protein